MLQVVYVGRRTGSVGVDEELTVEQRDMVLETAQRIEMQDLLKSFV
jgi:hypothetical protein